MTTGITCGRRRVRSSMNLASDLRGMAPHRVEVGRAFVGSVGDRSAYNLLRVFEQAFGFGCIHPAARDDLGTGHDLAGRSIDGDDDNYHAFFGEHAPVTQHAVTDVAHDSVDVHVAGGHRAPFDFRAGVADRDRVAVFADQDVIVGHTGVVCEARVMHQMPVLAMHRHEPFR